MDIKKIWEDFKEDSKERYYTFETIAGAWFMFAGAVLFFDLRTWSTLVPITIFLFGLRLFIVNRIKQKKKENELIGK